ncbi:MAG: MFS transporter, partial [Propionibacteriaceae bacterium]|nr:MFS transporter [Propionibacteriaceae bacterium]
DVTALRNRGFAAGVTVMTVAFGSFLGVMIVLPLVLQQVRHVSVLVAGLVLMPSGLLMGLLGPTVGRWFDARGARPLIVPGAAIVAVGIGVLAWTVTWAPVWVIGVIVGVVGLGLALLFTPIFTASLSDLPPSQYSHGSAILSTLQQVGGAAGTAAMMSVLSWGAALGVAAGELPDLGRGGTYALFAAAGLAVVTLLLTPLVPAGKPGRHGPATAVH